MRRLNLSSSLSASVGAAALIVVVLSACGAGEASLAAPELAPIEDRSIEDEVIYFVLPDRFENGDPSNDRGGIEGAAAEHGYDPTHTGFFHGGDLKGLTDRLDYIQGLGATAIWLTPIFENRAVQGVGDDISAGYHGYWITDFTNVDPHIGTRADFKAFVDAAHARGMKVYMDIIANHTADVISYRECYDPDWQGERVEPCSYRYIADYPWTTRGGVDGEAINDGFLGDDAPHQTTENFEKLNDLGWAYTPFVPEGLEGIKNPAWLNDPIYYHNRGETDFVDEDSLYGDFAGLDDLNTAHPKVVSGMIDIYKAWVTDYGVDGFRIDTAKHVRNEFWNQFAPAILEHAEAQGIDHFHMFGEVYEGGPNPQHLAKFTQAASLPTVLDFAFQSAAQRFVIDGGPGLELDRLFSADVVYEHGAKTARQLPTFLGNHDMGRFAGFLAASDPQMGADEALAKTRLAHGLMMFARGVPVIYYGDEQGFVSDRGDQGAREDMFPSKTESYNDNNLLGTNSTTAEANFDTQHPLYKGIGKLSAVRQGERALRHGEQVTRLAHREKSLFVFSRIDYEAGVEVVVAVNAEDTPQYVNVTVDGRAETFTSLLGECANQVSTTASYAMTIPALDIVVCKSEF